MGSTAGAGAPSDERAPADPDAAAGRDAVAGRDGSAARDAAAGRDAPAGRDGSAQPRALIVSVYGLYARHGGHPGWLPISLLVRLLAELDVPEPAVRSAISRLKRRGLLLPARHAGSAGYALSPAGESILSEGDVSIFAGRSPQPAPDWLLAVFSIPEAERAKRHTLRAGLGRLGFGAVAPGVWIAPGHRYELAAGLLRRLRLDSYVDLFRADYVAFADVEKMVGQWWDLAALREAYLDFEHACHGLVAGSDAAAFSAWVRTVTAWRRLPYLDPGLPPRLLPTDWPGPRAAARFAELRARLATPAQRFVTALAERE